MTKVGIITIHNSPSFGASLQSYALYRYLIDQGIDSSIIDLYRPANDGYIESKKYVSYRNRNQGLLMKMKSKIRRLVKGPVSKSSWKHVSKEKFDEFNSMVKFTQPYYRIDDLYADPPCFDVYISGSDQLWNPDQPFCIEPYFLTFVNNGGKKISYASSIGLSSLSTDVAADYKKWLSDFDSIAVREKTAQRLVQHLLNRDIPLVLDPTFLLGAEVWESELIMPLETNFVLLFTLAFNETLANLSVEYAENKGYKVIGIGKWDSPWPNIKKSDDIGPREFLGYIKNAKAVFTDSFHGTVFSIILGANRLFPYISKKSKRGSRISDLLNLFGIGHLLVSDETKIDFVEGGKTNRDEILEYLQNLKNISIDYLDDALCVIRKKA